MSFYEKPSFKRSVFSLKFLNHDYWNLRWVQRKSAAVVICLPTYYSIDWGDCQNLSKKTLSGLLLHGAAGET